MGGRGGSSPFLPPGAAWAHCLGVNRTPCPELCVLGGRPWSKPPSQKWVETAEAQGSPALSQVPRAELGPQLGQPRGRDLPASTFLVALVPDVESRWDLGVFEGLPKAV